MILWHSRAILFVWLFKLLKIEFHRVRCIGPTQLATSLLVLARYEARFLRYDVASGPYFRISFRPPKSNQTCMTRCPYVSAGYPSTSSLKRPSASV